MRQGLASSLGELAAQTGAELRGDPDVRIHAVATLGGAGPGAVSFLSNRKYRKYLETTAASAVYLAPENADECRVAALISDNPQLAFARAVRLLYPQRSVTGGIHGSAVVSPEAQIHPSAWIGPTAVIEAGVQIGAGAFVGPGCVVGEHCRVGDGTRLVARVTICGESELGRNVLVHPGAVIGADGFGFAKAPQGWMRIPQIGRVIIGDRVEIGANTTVDRGAIDDTVIEAGVILDNQIQIGHNVRLGENTAVAACTGISGSTRFGRDCIVGGDVGVAGHLDIGDGVFLAAGSKVTKSLGGPGSYGGVLPVDADPLWRRNVGRIRQLDEMAKRLKDLERRLRSVSAKPDQNGS